MAGDDDVATQVIDTEAEFPENGTYIDVDVYAVAPSERYPEGIKYSMQYGSDDGTTIFRYDNFPDHPDAPSHHKHVGETNVESVDFEGVFPLYRRFKQDTSKWRTLARRLRRRTNRTASCTSASDVATKTASRRP